MTSSAAAEIQKKRVAKAGNSSKKKNSKHKKTPEGDF